ncbi:MAG: pseudouridine synthase [Acidobacteriota bacterium]
MNDSSSSRSSRPSRVTMPEVSSFRGSPPATVLEWLALRFPRVPRSVWRERIDRGAVTLDAQGSRAAEAVTPELAYAAGRRVLYFREVAAGEEPVVPFRETVLHLDERLVVVDKPPFLPVTPGGPFVRECLLERLRGLPGCAECVPLHRLDRLTSGLVLFARQPADRGVYGELFARRRVEKRYGAMAAVDAESDGAGGLEAGSWTVRTRIEKGTPFFRMRQREDGEANSETRVRLLGRFGASSPARALFELRPITGKTHQLRLHMAHLGWPLVGDPLYPELRPRGPDRWQEPLRLVAEELRFEDPHSGEERRFRSRFRVERLAEQIAGEAEAAARPEDGRSGAGDI